MRTSRTKTIDVSAESWGRVVVIALAGTVVCVVATLFVDSFNFDGMDRSRLIQAMAVDILLPTFLALPLLILFSTKLRELAIANRRLTVYASTDGLTQIMNRAAFATLVEAYLTDIRTKSDAHGALLIIDADDFKSVNDNYGHDQGDKALITIAQTISSVLCTPEIVGRLGGEEFGVFLPGADREHAVAVAEEIRNKVSEAGFAPLGRNAKLTVSIGAAVFQETLPFGTLFRGADQQLYAAKHAGRNRVEICQIGNSQLGVAA